MQQINSIDWMNSQGSLQVGEKITFSIVRMPRLKIYFLCKLFKFLICLLGRGILIEILMY